MLLACLVACSGPDARSDLGAIQQAQDASPSRATIGSPCTFDVQCETGFCVDDVCCDLPCSGPCEACSASRKQSLEDGGTCGPALEGTDPRDSCTAEAQSTCGQTGQCDGLGACALYAFGASCGATSCTLNNVSGSICTGAGVCTLETTPQPCAPYVCLGGACQSPCATSADCLDGTDYCEGGVCRTKRANGQVCTAATTCQSGFCVDGVCCNTPCTGQCSACNSFDAQGSCGPVSGAPRGTRPPCSGTGACAGSCNGANLTSCLYPGSGVLCSAHWCEGDRLQPPGSCDGAGACAAPALVSCHPYGCDAFGPACRTSCTVNTDCAAGSVCNVDGLCVMALEARCRDAFTAALPDGTEASCAPYACSAGECMTHCEGNDCAPGYECVDTRCEAAGGSDGAAGNAGGASGGESPQGSAGSDSSGAPGDRSGGCACVIGSSSGPPNSLVFAWATSLALLFRRRVRSASSESLGVISRASGVSAGGGGGGRGSGLRVAVAGGVTVAGDSSLS